VSTLAPLFAMLGLVGLATLVAAIAANIASDLLAYSKPKLWK